MTDIQAVSSTKHTGKSWSSPTRFTFAEKDNVVMIGWHEIPQAMMQLPLALMLTKHGYQVVMVMGFNNGDNSVVTPQGQWRVDYIPASYRYRPFRLGKNEQGQFVLCVDHNSGLVHDDARGKAFVGEDKQLTDEVKTIGEALVKLESARTGMAALSTTLEKLALIEAWPLQVKGEDKHWKVDGLFRINEERLAQLPAEDLKTLRDAGGLMLCYAQLLSMQNIHRLARLAHQKSQSATMQAAQNRKEILLSDNNGTISFDGLL